jgi:DNA-binding PadR family transcriptional regulator
MNKKKDTKEKRIYLTRQEELFMLTIFRLEEPAYLVNIRDHLLEYTGKDWAFGSIYITLNKLKKKDFVTSKTGSPMQKRGGKSIQYYELTGSGIKALTHSKQVQDVMWREFSAFLEKGESM